MPIRPINRSVAIPSLTDNAAGQISSSDAAQNREKIRGNIAPPRSRPSAASARAAEPAQERSTGEYEVGYKKPPKHRQFKSGQSGNPKGRPKGAKSLNTMARTVFGEMVVVKTPAGERRMNAVELGLNKLRELAAKGDIKAIRAVLEHWARSVPEPVEVQTATPAERTLAPEEEQILAHLLGNLDSPASRLDTEAADEC